MRFPIGRRVWLSGLVVVLVLVAIFLMRGHRELVVAPHRPDISNDHGQLTVSSDAPVLSALTIAPVHAVTLPHQMEVPGMVASEPTRTVTVLAPVSGRVLSVSARLGQRVARGDVLAVIASGDLAQAYADDLKARAALMLAQRAFDRAQGVLKVGGNAVKDLDSARNDLAQAEAEAGRTGQRLAALDARAAYSRTGAVPLIAPMDGIVSALNMAPGNFISDLTAVQMSIVDLREVWVTAEIPEDQASFVTVGQAATVRLTGADGSVPGRVAAVDPLLQADTRRLGARIVCDNPEGRLLPNMFAMVSIGIPQASAFMVPKSALLMNNDAISVFVQVGERRFERRFVSVSYDEGDTVRVLSGLKDGEQVVTIGGVLLNDD